MNELEVVGYVEAAKITGLTVNHLRVLNHRGQLPTPVAKGWWKRSDLVDWAEARKTAAAGSRVGAQQANGTANDRTPTAGG